MFWLICSIFILVNALPAHAQTDSTVSDSTTINWYNHYTLYPPGKKLPPYDVIRSPGMYYRDFSYSGFGLYTGAGMQQPVKGLQTNFNNNVKNIDFGSAWFLNYGALAYYVFESNIVIGYELGGFSNSGTENKTTGGEVQFSIGYHYDFNNIYIEPKLGIGMYTVESEIKGKETFDLESVNNVIFIGPNNLIENRGKGDNLNVSMNFAGVSARPGLRIGYLINNWGFFADLYYSITILADSPQLVVGGKGYNNAEDYKISTKAPESLTTRFYPSATDNPLLKNNSKFKGGYVKQTGPGLNLGVYLEIHNW
ncbi:MAG: hypothetical protein V4543_17570 [Bacteroidota bacterium]